MKPRVLSSSCWDMVKIMKSLNANGKRIIQLLDAQNALANDKLKLYREDQFVSLKAHQTQMDNMTKFERDYKMEAHKEDMVLKELQQQLLGSLRSPNIIVQEE